MISNAVFHRVQDIGNRYEADVLDLNLPKWDYDSPTQVAIPGDAKAAAITWARIAGMVIMHLGFMHPDMDEEKLRAAAGQYLRQIIPIDATSAAFPLERV